MSKVKTIQDYYEQLYEMYPTLPKEDIRRACQYGWKAFSAHNSYGGDVLIERQGFWFYSGTLMKDSLKWFNYYKMKLRIKLRVTYKKKKIEWDNNYYFALSQKQYEDYLNQKKKRGRPRKHFKFTDVFLYKLFDECNIIESGKVAIFKIPYFIDQGFTHYKKELVTDKAELILTREPLKFNDILYSNYNFQF